MNKPFIPSLKSFLAVVCCLLLSAGAYAQRFTYTYHSVEFKCKIKSGETVCITGFDQKAEIVRVPSTVEYAGRKYPVKEIDTYISGNNYSTVSLTIEEGIEEIANYSFVEFRDLKEVHLPETVKKIGKNTFADIANIPQFHASQEICQEFKITEKVQLAEEKEKKKSREFETTYKSQKFQCVLSSGVATIIDFDTKAINVTIPSEVEYNGVVYPVRKIGLYRPQKYHAQKLIIEEGVEEITNYSFSRFKELQEVHLPQSLIKIGKKTFDDVDKIPQFYASAKICKELGVDYQPLSAETTVTTQPVIQQTLMVSTSNDKEEKKEAFTYTNRFAMFNCVLHSEEVTITEVPAMMRVDSIVFPSIVSSQDGTFYPVKRIILKDLAVKRVSTLIIEEGVEEFTIAPGDYGKLQQIKVLQEVRLPQSLKVIGKKTFVKPKNIPHFYASAEICKELGIENNTLTAEGVVTQQNIPQVLSLFVTIDKEKKKGGKEEKIQEFETIYKSQKFQCFLISGVVTIYDFEQDASSITIPGEVEYNGTVYPVRKIALDKRCHAQKLIIEEGVEEIINYSFRRFKELQEVHLPQSLKVIGKKAFDDVEKIPQFYASAEICKELGIDSRPLLAGTPTLQPQKPSKQPSPMFLMSGDGDVSVTPREEQNAVQQEAPEINGPTISDVDTDIPQNKQENEYSFAIIIANETYDVETPVEFALHDGKIFKEYCTNLLGIPEENIRLLENASHMQIRRTVEWLKKVAQAYSGVCRIYFYYAGHGMPDEEKRCAYILPTDGYASDVAISGYSLKELYDTLGRLPAQSVTVFLDACFSGMKRNGTAIVAARGVSIRPEEETLSGNVVVFSATSEAETAYSYRNKGHGLFTYYLLKKLKQSRGNVSYEELSRYVQTEVMRKSLTLNDKSQTPTVTVSPNMESKWKKINFNIQH
ncbi:MAG: leucine-rich repeat protein [Bacteroides sp.]|nr:leucine-rich repeat protein [Bacteroides sp.]